MKEFLNTLTIWNVLEVAAVVTGMIYVFLQVKQTRRMWRWMIIASIFNGIVFFHKEFYSMTVIQFYYIGMSIYGLYKWTNVKKSGIEQHGPDDPKHRTKIGIIKPSPKKILLSAAVAAVAFAVLVTVCSANYTYVEGDIPYKPYWDAALAVLSMYATYLLSQSYISNWYVWITVNIAAIVAFLYPVFVGHPERAIVMFGLLYVYYLVTCIVGLINWKKKGVYVDVKPNK